MTEPSPSGCDCNRQRFAVSKIGFEREIMTVTVYSKPACVQCTATYRALDRIGVPYEIIDISEDADALDHVRGLGYMQVPVVVAGERHWAGFRPDMIGAIS
ncbi:Glutaredoxin-like protein nrdH [Agrobacterium tumefaciens]|nr:Glutaredoxin-like protein nrdH [Agrobacterium tumefaciens]